MNFFFRKVKVWAQRRQKESELQEELQFHLDEEAEELQAQGAAEQEAISASRRALGNYTRVKEETRSVWNWTILEQLGQDLRYAVRTMIGNWQFSILAILLLAIGIGANTAIYSFMDFILFRSLPVSDPDSLVVLNWHAQARGGPPAIVRSVGDGMYVDSKFGTTAVVFPFPAFTLFEKQNTIFSSVFAYSPARQRSLMFNGLTDLASGEYVSGEYFHSLGVLPAAGRLIMPEDDRPGAPMVAVVSHAFSHRRFGGPGNAVGQSILINNWPFVVAGVTQPGFQGIDPATPADFFLPIRVNLTAPVGGPAVPAAMYLDPYSYWVRVMGRLRPGVSAVQAQSVLAPSFQQWVTSKAESDRERANLPALLVQNGAGGLDTLRRQFSKPLYVLMTLVGLMLAIACANVANLLLARGAARRREMAIRMSVGAGRFRVIRQLLTESALLAVMGGVWGVLLAMGGIRFLGLLLASGQAEFALQPDLNWRVLAVTAALSILTGVMFGLAPAVQSTRMDCISAMKETGIGRPPVRNSLSHFSMRGLLVVGQVALSLLLLAAAGLFIRTLMNLHSIELGFNRENVLLFQVNARQAGYKDAAIGDFYARLQTRLRTIPGVSSVSLSHSPLIEPGMGFLVGIPGEKPAPVRVWSVGPDYFNTMQIPIVAGREFYERDQSGSKPAVVVNEMFARATFGDRNPIGQRLSVRMGRTSREVEIIGVSKTVRSGGLRQAARPAMFVLFNQEFLPLSQMVYALRTKDDPLSIVDLARQIVRDADAHVLLAKVRTQAAEIDQNINQEIVFAKLCTAFAILGLMISCIGLYGSISYSVARRTSEIGIRIALGAQRSSVIRLVLREGLVLAAGGLAIGLTAALGLSRFIASFLYGVLPNDPLALTLAMTALLGTALLAVYAPARRASRIDPITALRHD